MQEQEPAKTASRQMAERAYANMRASQQPATPPRLVHRTGGKHPNRNDLCPCGSGKKYKRCCLRSARHPLAEAPPSV